MEFAHALMALLNVFMAALMFATVGRCRAGLERLIAWALAIVNILAAAINIAAVIS